MKRLLLPFLFLSILTAANSQDVRDTAVENTFFWKITGPGLTNPSYLYGTYHRTCAADVWFSPLLLETLKSCKLFFNETIDFRNLRDSAPGKTKNGLREFLGKNYFRSGKKLLESFYGPMNEEQLDTMGTTEFGDRLIEACHNCRVISYDDSLYNLASQNSLEQRGLETLIELEKYLPGKLQLTPSRDWLRNYISFPERNRNSYLRDMSYYRNHDINSLYKEAAYTKSGEDRSVKDKYLDGRNKLWLLRIEDAMKEGSSFFAVGCAHLPGYNGLISQLRKKGYTVTPLFYSARNQ